MTTYGKRMLQASLQQRKVGTKASLEEQSEIAKPTHIGAPSESKVEKWLASCPDDVSEVSTERVLPSVKSDVAVVPFPKLRHQQQGIVDVEEGDDIDENDGLDSESDEYSLERDDESDDLSDELPNQNCEESETLSLKSDRDLFEGTSILCGLVLTADRRREYEKPSLVLTMGHLLKKLTIIKTCFGVHQDQNVYPSGLQIKTIKANYPFVASKSVFQGKLRLQHLMKR
ncbi:hypothetical protein PoB_003878800 [Plakobranchus ocellatus]|uniref:Uncharacterized protein n=1 Tax=Plakobranchus ocellatus TaxID=259542 RepID=A0AAV4B0N1_9GAST|nr:hypothetical protein PoB_003878800 [Plakobranchus ocellatus]